MADPRPDDETLTRFRVEELSARTGAPVRTIREYQTWQILHPPTKVGRVGFYDETHVRRLEGIARLQERGYSIAAIRDLFDAWDQGAGLRDVLGLDDVAAIPADEAPVALSAADVAELLPSIAGSPRLLARAGTIGLWFEHGDGYVARSPALVQLVADGIGTGLSTTAALDLAAAVVAASAQVGEATATVLAGATSGTVDIESLARRGRVLLARAVATHTIDQVGRHLAAHADEIPELGELLADVRIGSVTTRSTRPAAPARGTATPDGLSSARVASETRTCSRSAFPSTGGPSMALRVIQWATGGVGRAAIEGVLAHPDLELAGCWVHSADKDGQDVGTLIGTDELGITATTDIDALLAVDADCVVYSPFMADARVVTRILESGKNVVTPLGWFYPPDDDRQRFDTIAREAGVTLHGTGIHPGGITERFPLMVSALSGTITHVRAEEFSDIRTYGAPDVIRDWMLFGTTPEEARTSIMADALGAGFRQSVWMVADVLGFDLDPQLRTTHEMAVATAPIDSPIGPIEPGTVAAQRFLWEGLVDGEPVVTAAVNWLMGEEHLDPAWAFGPGGERFEVEVTGDPSCLTTFQKLHPHSIEEGLARNPGIVATAMHCVNAVPYVCAAEPGLQTYLDLPLVAGRAAPGLHRDRSGS